MIKNIKENKIKKTGNFTPNCMPVKIAQNNIKVLLMPFFLQVKENNKHDRINEATQKVNELYDSIRPCAPYNVNGVKEIKAVCTGDQLLLNLQNFSLTAVAKINPDSK